MARLSKVMAAVALARTAFAVDTCPGSGSSVHASCQVSVKVLDSCDNVMAEMEARVAGIATGAWHDPHNRGTYSVLSKAPYVLQTQRVTGNGKYTDKQTFLFKDVFDFVCQIDACSESQGFSIKDFSTNYCDMRMLYCGSQEGCKPVKHDFNITEMSVKPSIGAGTDPKACLVATATSAATEFLQAAPASAARPSCPPAGFDSVQNFDLEAFVSKRWYIQYQMPVVYLPASENRCVYAEYKLADKKTFWGYDVAVHNYAEDVAPPHKVHDSGDYVCAKIVDRSTGKLEVGPCFLPKFLSGDYWVIDYSEEEGYALVSGGAPKISAPGGCRTGSGTNGSGLWIFTRARARDEVLVKKVMHIAEAKGFDISVLNPVDQTDCEATAATRQVTV